MALYDRIGRTYDVTRRADPYITSRLLSLLSPTPQVAYLDVACGSGNYTSALAARGVRMVGLDLSPLMLRSARGKSSSVSWVNANAASLPFPNGVMGGAVCTLAFHHFPAVGPVLAEVGRVVSPGGRFVGFTSTPEQMERYWLNHYFPKALTRSAQRMPGLPLMLEGLQAAGFHVVTTEPYRVAEDLQDLFLYGGKHRPELYLDPRVRAGMSTFANLSGADEVERGCRLLAQDIASGRIAEIRRSYEHPNGDYLFLVARKTRRGRRTGGTVEP
ncbi:MAG: class I SAM-dependent methyltransferase [SAR202 cluster bacterium]|nr:class I SAM-dependent methyltransferase [SAR202 cluster bacterium]